MEVCSSSKTDKWVAMILKKNAGTILYSLIIIIKKYGRNSVNISLIDTIRKYRRNSVNNSLIDMTRKILCNSLDTFHSHEKKSPCCDVGH